MEVNFNKKTLQYLQPFYSQVHSQEQTQEIRLPDNYPDVGQILGTWGQIIIRGKEWRNTGMNANGGITAWVLYAPEDGSQMRVVEAWIPFQCRWDFPDSFEDGTMILRPLLTNVDSRSISARKLIVRVCVDTYVQALHLQKSDILTPIDVPEDVQLLTRSYPMDLPAETGEKQMQIEENVILPQDRPQIQKIINYQIEPSISESKLLGNRLIFRGQITIPLMYLSADNEICRWSIEIPFSQYTELDREYEQNASACIIPVITASEINLDENMQLQIHLGITAQYTVFDRNLIDVVEDAFSTKRQVNFSENDLFLPCLLDSTVSEMEVEANLNGLETQMIHVTPYCTYPIMRLGQNDMVINMDGHYHCLCKMEDALLKNSTSQFHGETSLQTLSDNRVYHWMGCPSKTEVLPNGEFTLLRNKYPITVHVYSGQPISMITELKLGELQNPDESRPSIILRRAGEESLWEIAKSCGATVASIKEVNRLEGEPEQDKMLLIPIQ